MQHQLHGAFGAALLDGIEQLLVLVVAARGGVRRVVQEDGQHRHRGQLAHGVRQRAVARQPRQLDVEPARQPHDDRAISALARVLLVGHHRAQRGHGRRIAPGDQAPHQRRLQQAAGLEHLTRLLGRGRRHEGAAVGHHVDDALVGQPRQHVAHLRTAGGEQLGQAVFHQLGTRRQPVLEHGAPHAVEDGLAQGHAVQRGGGGGGFAGGHWRQVRSGEILEAEASGAPGALEATHP